jgi:hypothetical protein
MSRPSNFMHLCGVYALNCVLKSKAGVSQQPAHPTCCPLSGTTPDFQSSFYRNDSVKAVLLKITAVLHTVVSCSILAAVCNNIQVMYTFLTVPRAVLQVVLVVVAVRQIIVLATVARYAKCHHEVSPWRHVPVLPLLRSTFAATMPTHRPFLLLRERLYTHKAMQR